MKSILVGLVLVLGWQAQAQIDSGLVGFRLANEAEKQLFIKNVSANMAGRKVGLCSDGITYDMNGTIGELVKADQVFVSENKSQPLFIFRSLSGAFDELIQSTPDLKNVINLSVRRFSVQRVPENTLLEDPQFIETVVYSGLVSCPVY